MLDLEKLRQLVAFADLGTLSRVAEEFHISTPSITRSMQSLEDSFGAPLFVRSKNRIELNETGLFAVTLARRLLAEAGEAVRQVKAFDARRKTIVVKSCAPAPLWALMKKLEESCPGMTVSSSICQNEEVQAAWADGTCDVAILPFPFPGAHPQKLMEEHLFVCVPPDYALAGHEGLTFAQINGFNFLLRSELGFWDTLCRRKMPASRFLVQTDASTFDELVNSSSLPCFVTDYAQHALPGYPGRVSIPLLDEEANVSFYVAVRDSVPWKPAC